MGHANNCNCLSCTKKSRSQHNEKQIAQAILDAQKMREESYVAATNYKRDNDDDDSVEGVLVADFGKYTKDFEECFIATCKKAGLSPNMWSLLCLANHWYNDIQLWAEDVLAGKNILEEAEKENAKMKDGIKNWEEEAYNDSPEVENGQKLLDELADNVDDVVSAEFTETIEDDLLKNASCGLPFGEAAMQQEIQESKNKGCPCNFASTENCEQCRDTDDQGDLKNS